MLFKIKELTLEIKSLSNSPLMGEHLGKGGNHVYIFETTEREETPGQ